MQVDEGKEVQAEAEQEKFKLNSWERDVSSEGDKQGDVNEGKEKEDERGMEVRWPRCPDKEPSRPSDSQLTRHFSASPCLLPSSSGTWIAAYWGFFFMPVWWQN